MVPLCTVLEPGGVINLNSTALIQLGWCRDWMVGTDPNLAHCDVHYDQFDDGRSRSFPSKFCSFDNVLFESGTTGSRTNQSASFPTPSATSHGGVKEMIKPV